jgi:hypothetical protein
MKNHNLIISAAAIGFSLLFYEQLPGINYLLFTLLLTACGYALQPPERRNRNWWLCAGLMNVAAISVFITGSVLSTLSTIATMVFFAATNSNPRTSLPLALFTAAFSVISAPVRWCMDVSDAREQSQVNKRKTLAVFGSVMASLLIVIVFFYLYRVSNPLFDSFASKIDLSWLSLLWVFFTILGFFILYGLLRPFVFEKLVQLDRQASSPIADKGIRNTNTTIPFIVFVMLNLMLLFINGLDVQQIFVSKKLPEGITLSQFVHEAVAATIMSIVAALTMIAWFFRSDANFTAAGKKVRILIYVWMAQTVLVIVSTMVRNSWYIQEYQLTNLRIGVYVFLALSIVGMALTYAKLQRTESAWWLFSANVKVWFATFVIMGFLNWDILITDYNLSHSDGRKPDINYLIGLSSANNPQLAEYYPRAKPDEQEMIRNKLFEDRWFAGKLGWPSFNLRRHRALHATELLPKTR